MKDLQRVEVRPATDAQRNEVQVRDGRSTQPLGESWIFVREVGGRLFRARMEVMSPGVGRNASDAGGSGGIAKASDLHGRLGS